MNRRVAITLPPLVALASGIALLAASLAAWGAGNGAGLPAWLTTFGGVMFSLPAIVASYLCLRTVRGLTSESFFVSNLQLLLGTFIFGILIAWVLALTLNVGDSDSYEGVVLEGGSSLSTLEMLVVIGLITGLKGFFAAAAAYLYTSAITAEYFRHARVRNESDGVGELIRQRSEGVSSILPDARALFSRPPNDRG